MVPIKGFRSRTWLTVLLSVLLSSIAPPAAFSAERSPPTADHSKFEALQGPFSSAQEVTEACLGCHNEAANQIRETTYWTWTYDHPETGPRRGPGRGLEAGPGP